MLNKMLLKKAAIFFLPLPLVFAEVLYLAHESVQSNLDHLLEKNIQIADEILFQIETENRTALIHPERCEQLQQNLMFERDIDEMLIVKGDEIICSSKLGHLSKPLSEYLTFRPNHALTFGQINGLDEPLLLVVTQGQQTYKAITIIDRDYFGATIGFNNDLRLKRQLCLFMTTWCPLAHPEKVQTRLLLMNLRCLNTKRSLKLAIYLSSKS